MTALPADINPPIIIEGAATHNLKHVSCEIPAGKITVVTGVSGSGKSSLAFDTLFAEGQRRYVESLSTYARQFIARMPRPDVERIDNIPPAIALEQKNSVRNARSTIGTATEISDHLRLLFARAAVTMCPTTNQPVEAMPPDLATRKLLADHTGARVSIVGEVRLAKPALREGTLKELVRQGFTRLLTPDGTVLDLDDPANPPPKDLHPIPVLVDRLAIAEDERNRLAEALENAFRLGDGLCTVQIRGGATLRLSQTPRCAGCPGDCGLTFREPSPQLLSFSSPLGACPTCEGFGRVTGLDWDKVIPSQSVSIDDGAIAAFSGESSSESLADLRKYLRTNPVVRLDVPWRDLTDREREIVRFGEGKWYGIKGFFDYLETKRYKVQARVMLARYRGYTPCPDCGGTRLRQDALRLRLGGRHIGELSDMSVEDLGRWFAEVKLTPEQAAIAERPLQEIRARLGYLESVGLGYLTLSRQTRTLSGGESQRINLSTALGSALTESLYVLDEPTVGLHPRDTQRLLDILRRLRDLGNTVVLVEHDLDVIEAADYLIDIGPAAGEKGGTIVFSGPPASFINAPPSSRTGEFLRPRASGKSAAPARKLRKAFDWVYVRGARENNLRNVDVAIPLGVLCCVTGVSGSGKSTLIKACLFGNYEREFRGITVDGVGAIESLAGFHKVEDVLLVDQSPIGRSSRSNPATYLKAYDGIRDLLASTADAAALTLTPRDFSFNVAGGRCEVCEGTGRQVIDMHFLSDVEVVCEACDGQRFLPTVLDVRWNGHNITSILELTIDDACEVFAEQRKILNGLLPLKKVGLGYLRLGQSTATLSGGEAQRLKLAAHLAGVTGKKNALLLFDEPTTGLHAADLQVLQRVFDQLLDEGFSLVIIEHNLELIRNADWVIDMGPEGGGRGGNLVVAGTPRQVADCAGSITGKFLREGGH